VNKETIAQIGALVTKVSVTYSRKVSTGDYGSEGAVFGVEADTPAGADIDAVGDALYAWAKTVATRNLAPDLRAHTEAADALAEAYAPVAHEAAFGPPEAQAPAKEESEEGHTRIARFTLETKGEDRYLLALYPRMGDKPGRYKELEFTAKRDEMWKMVGEELKATFPDGTLALPLDKECDWMADWKLGRDKTEAWIAGGKKWKQPNPGSRYKDLIAIHGV